MTEFTVKRIYKKNNLKKSLTDWDKDYEAMFSNLSSLIFADDKTFMSRRYDARLWLREIFLSAQTHAT